MSDKTSQIFNLIKHAFLDNPLAPLSISEISKKSEINWRTAERYLKILKDYGVIEEKNDTRTFYYIEDKDYFKLPIKMDDRKTLSMLYFHIKKVCLELFKKEPTKTQVYKIAWKVNKKLKLNLPVGWYLYGPCCVQIYTGEEKSELSPSEVIVSSIKEITNDYCSLSNQELQEKVYSEVDQRLYLAKEKLLKTKFENKDDLNLVLLDLIRNAPSEAVDVVTDFARASLFLGWDRTEEIFEFIWKYVALVVFKDSLSFYYGDFLDLYFDEKIDGCKKEAQLYILNLMNNRNG